MVFYVLTRNLINIKLSRKRISCKYPSFIYYLKSYYLLKVIDKIKGLIEKRVNTIKSVLSCSSKSRLICFSLVQQASFLLMVSILANFVTYLFHL